jgi:hypothetical protein
VPRDAFEYDSTDKGNGTSDVAPRSFCSNIGKISGRSANTPRGSLGGGFIFGEKAMREEEVFVTLAAMVLAFLIIRVLARAVTRIICHWHDTQLKIRLVEAGISSREIEQIVGAGTSTSGGCRKADVPAKPPVQQKQYEYAP